MEAAAEILPAAAWAEGSRLSVVYDSDLMGRDIRTMMLSETGGIIEMPTALSIDGVLDGVPAGQQTLPAVAFGGGRFGAAFIAFPGGPAQTTVRFLTPDRNSPAPGVEAGTTSVLSGASTSIGMTTDGAALVVFGDAASPTGLSGRIFAAGSTMPAGDSFPVGTGLTGATAPAVAGSSTGFVVAFAAAGAIHYQRYAADGTPTDAAAVAVAGAMGDAPAAASLSDGRTAIAFAAGFTVRAQVFDAAMAPVGSLLDVGAGGEPTIAASRDRFVVAYVEGSGIMARLVSPDGAFALNRNQPPSTDAFQVATGNVSAPAAAAGGTSAEPLFIVTFQDQSTDPAGDVNGRLFPLP
jgi:hypothetical protein